MLHARFLVLTLAGVALLGMASPAAAARRVALLDLSSSDVDADARKQLPELVEAGLKKDGHFELAAASATEQALSATKKEAARCAKDKDCLKKVARKVDAELILTTSLERAKKGFVLTVALGRPDAMDSAKRESESMRLIKSLGMNVSLCLERLLPGVAASPSAAAPAPASDFNDLPPIPGPDEVAAAPAPAPAPAPEPAPVVAAQPAPAPAPAPAAAAAPAGPQDKCQARVGSKAPPFSITMSDGSEGVMLRKSLEKKVPVVVAFWAYHCKPCQHELPMLQKLADEVGSQVSFLLIHDGPDESLMKQKLAELNVTLPSASDDTRAKEEKYCVTALPKTFVIESDGKNGTIRAIFDEANDKELRATLAGLGVKVSAG